MVVIPDAIFGGMKVVVNSRFLAGVDGNSKMIDIRARAIDPAASCEPS
jgi:hypothetical protein